MMSSVSLFRMIKNMSKDKKEKEVLRLLGSVEETYSLQDFISFDVQDYIKLLESKGEEFWIKKGEEKAIRLFKRAAKDVPAYKKFLKQHKVDVSKIKTIKDFKNLPITTKENYINKYSLTNRNWNGELKYQNIFAVSSGTTDKPKIWPRGSLQEFESAIIHELIFNELYEIDKYKTLVAIGFPMGIYVSGIATSIPSWLVTTKYPNLAILTIGNNKKNFLNIIPQLQKEYEQILLIGHPFFIKDIVETGKKRKIKWEKTKLRMMFCSEGFNEIWRSHLADQVKGNKLFDIFNTYGSSELLLIGNETPKSIFIKQLAEKNDSLRESIFKSLSVPNIFQYNPINRYIESIDNDLIFTASSGIPLIRFKLYDNGQIISSDKIDKILAKKYPIWNNELKKIKLIKNWKLPFITLYGRKNEAIIFYAANIYIENIHQALDYRPFLKKITGKFVMEKKYLKNMDQYLEIYIELKEGLKKNKQFAKDIQTRIVSTLKKINMEYADASEKLDKNLVPRITLRYYEDEKYFKRYLKPKYII